MKPKQWQNIFHVIVNANSIIQFVTQIKNGIIKHFNVNVKIIVRAKNNYSWNPTTCICENSKYLKSILGTEHVRLVCDIYFAYAYLCRCNSTVFCFWELKSRQLIFLINWRFKLTRNYVSWAKKMRNESLTMITLAK